MKNSFLPMLGLLLLTVHSCSKNGSETSLLVGKWTVVNDSSLKTNMFYALPLGDSGTNSSNYIGEQCGATFDFYSDGNIVTSFFDCSFAFPLVDSAKYVLAGNQVTISILAQNLGCCSFTHLNPVITRRYTLSNLTANTVTLTFQSVYSPPSGGVSGMETEIINLKK